MSLRTYVQRLRHYQETGEGLEALIRCVDPRVSAKIAAIEDARRQAEATRRENAERLIAEAEELARLRREMARIRVREAWEIARAGAFVITIIGAWIALLWWLIPSG